MEVARDFSARLPPEVHRMLLALLPNSDLKNTRLVSKRWGALAATVLWSDFTIHLCKTGSEKLEALVDSKDIMNNIKKLTVSTKHQNSRENSQTAWKLHNFLAALPRDVLVSFTSVEYKVDHLVLGTLLQAQSQLQHLSVNLCETQIVPGLFSGLPGAMYIRNNLGNMRSVRIHVTGEHHSKYQGLAAWFPYMPALRDLRITGRLDRGTNVFNGWRLPAHAPLLKLHKLLLEDLQLYETADDIVDILDLDCLQTLTIDHCSNTGPLLRSFTRGFRKTKNPSLTKYYNRALQLTEDDCEATEELFESVECLVDVIYITAEESRPPRLSSLHRNGNTLKRLCLVASKPSQLYSTRDLGNVPIDLPNLEILGLAIGDLSQRIDVLGNCEPFDISSDQDYANALEVLAQMPKLRRLLIGDRPYLQGEGYNSQERQWRYAQIAEQILGCLANHGSCVQFLNFSPIYMPDNTPEEDDDNGHCWPVYHYMRGNVTADAARSKGVIKTVAIPVPQGYERS